MEYVDENLYISDEDDEINRIGNVPLHWYDEFDHQGYTIDGERLKKLLNKSDSELQSLLNSTDPDSWRTIFDQKNQTSVRLTDEDLDIIRRISSHTYANPDFDAEGFNYEEENLEDKIFPVSNRPVPKRGFIPSKWEAKKITRLVRLIRLKILRPVKKREPEVFDIWEDAIIDPVVDETASKGPPHIPAPRMELPVHEHSYNPPEEYLLDEDEISKLEKDGELETTFIPSKYDCLRRVPAYDKLISERFERCLDLYLCPRAIKMRMNVDPESILPPPIDTSDLKPYPTSVRIKYDIDQPVDYKNVQLSVSPDGFWLASGMGTMLSIFEVSTSRLSIQLDISKITQQLGLSNQESSSEEAQSEPSTNFITSLAFHPSMPILACGAEEYLLILVLRLPNICFSDDSEASTDVEQDDSSLEPSSSSGNKEKDPREEFKRSLELFSDLSTYSSGSGNAELLSWSKIDIDSCSELTKELGSIVVIKHQSAIRHLTWHSKGGYLAVVSPRAISPSQRVVIHSINRCSSINAFKKLSGMVKSVQFHSSNPWLIVATQTCIRVVDLTSSKTGNKKLGNQNTNKALIKKLVGIEDPTSISLDSTGKHIFVGQSNGRIAWFDLDLGNTPYKLLRYSESAIRQVQFHQGKSMVFSASKNGTINVFHCRMPADLMSDPVFVPLKVIKGELSNIHSAIWHPKQPWIFSAGVNGEGKPSLFLWG
ncbi:Erb1p-like protein [Cryptosporidium canis]|uniref:Erb1p-like protein n=1 Tax=Cryptosporidium canis TaxID=195482 RepID=A0ABQ8P5T3_9CRYT|nr:Erb1p-like protein [Cryptosporidium canis]KAJ1609398.1 Erb1p-like protein [Cryptosporidium canis]